MWGFSPDEIQAWIAASNQQTGVTTPVVVVKVRYRCDSCKQFMSPLETMAQHGAVYCHMTEKCLTKFAKKHKWEDVNFKKQQLITSNGDI